MKSVQARVESILAHNRYMTIATATKTGNPWVSPVFFARHGNRLYWYSPRESRHSKLISKNPRVAITIFDSRLTPQKADGLYIEGTARVLRRKELAGALAVLAQKIFTGTKRQRAMARTAPDFTGNSPLRVYAARAKKMWVLGPTRMYKGNYVDSREAVA